MSKEKSNLSLEDKVVLANPSDPIDLVVRKMEERSGLVRCPGLAIIVDADKRALGVLTDGDIRRSYFEEVSWDASVDSIMSMNPIGVPVGLSNQKFIEEVFRQAEHASHLSARYVRYVLVLDRDQRVVDVKDFFHLLWHEDQRSERVVVFGLGFVGLTVAVALANVGYHVVGFDTNVSLIKQLAGGQSHVHEPGLDDMLAQLLTQRVLAFSQNTEDLVSDQKTSFIIAVGTPVDEEGVPDTADLRSVCEQIGSLVNKDDQVIVRSTVPVGTTRAIVAPILEQRSGLVVGTDICLSFCPERTLAGKAMEELRTLPQLVGGYSEHCMSRATQFWGRLNPSTVLTQGLEAAELAKLANNSFRDLVFGFSNQLINLADRYNLVLSDVITAANNGYPRNAIPLPSPGVGGYCLTKDPYLLSASLSSKEQDLGSLGREINEAAATYAMKHVERFCSKIGSNIEDMTALVIGLAFKGEPETNDYRGSCGIKLARRLMDAGATVYGWDEVLHERDATDVKFSQAGSKSQAIAEADLVLIMNNHRKNPMHIVSSIAGSRKLRLIFDGWGQLNRPEVEKIDGATYCTLGYSSEQ